MRRSSVDGLGHDDDFIFEEFARIRLKGHESGHEDTEAWRTRNNLSFSRFYQLSNRRDSCLFFFFFLFIACT